MKPGGYAECQVHKDFIDDNQATLGSVKLICVPDFLNSCHFIIAYELGPSFCFSPDLRDV